MTTPQSEAPASVGFTTPVGPERTGKVLVLLKSIGSGYIMEDGTNRQFSLVKKFAGAASGTNLLVNRPLTMPIQVRSK